jgi:precorrin-2/cobalt-factor-2 C20-methyltransferase
MTEKGRLYGIGVGPGDAELLTLKAVRLIRSCDVIAIPQKDRDRCVSLRIAIKMVPEALDKPLLCLDMPMTRNKKVRESACAAAAERLISVLSTGKTVAFLTLGDPTVYSTYGYLHRRITQSGYAAEMIPGVPSFCAAAAALGEPLCMDEEPLHLLPGGPADAARPGTRVFMKGGVKALRERLRDHEGPILGARNVGMADQRLFRSLNDIPDDTGYFTLIIAKEKQP